MNEEQFKQLRWRAYRNEAPEEIIAAVELEPGLATRASGGDGETILHNACAGGHIDLARDLVDRQANVHQRDTFGKDALMCASLNGHIPVMEFLLSRGADTTARDNRGDTALGYAAWNEELPACKYLITRGSDLMSKNNQGETALDIYGDEGDVDDEDKKQRCDELLAAFIEAKDLKIASKDQEISSLVT